MERDVAHGYTDGLMMFVVMGRSMSEGTLSVSARTNKERIRCHSIRKQRACWT